MIADSIRPSYDICTAITGVKTGYEEFLKAVFFGYDPIASDELRERDVISHVMLTEAPFYGYDRYNY